MTSRSALHWPEYLAEAGLLGLLMIVASTLGVVLGHPASPAVRVIPDPLARRALFGLAIGATVIAITYSPAGMRSGGHLNPSMTLAFLWLRKVRTRDAVFYVTAQLAGAVAGVLAAWAALGRRLAHPAVHFITTRPGHAGPIVAFAAEAAISFVLMSVVLWVLASRHAAWTGVCAGVLVALYVTFEGPISGMSMNPARSLGSALPAQELGAIWIYAIAPPLGMLTAATLLRQRAAGTCAKLFHSSKVSCIFCGRGMAPAYGEGRVAPHPAPLTTPFGLETRPARHAVRNA
jgi:aquaporin Z